MPTKCNRQFLLQILLLAQHVSGTIMPIIRSIQLAFYFHILTTMHGQSHIKNLTLFYMRVCCLFVCFPAVTTHCGCIFTAQ